MIVNADYVFVMLLTVWVGIDSRINEKLIDWCKLKCGKKINIVCSVQEMQLLDKKVWNTKDCFNLRISMTPEFRRDLILLHNTLRNEVASGNTKLPPAANMRQMSWDVYLEASAEAWARSCSVGLAKCRRTKEFKIVSQNYYLLGGDNTPVPDSTESFNAWASQIFHLTKDQVKNFSRGSELVDDVVHILWGDTFRLGCSEASYKQAGLYFKSLICNYGPGSELGSPIYQTGDRCAACFEGSSCESMSNFTSLCATPDDNIDYLPPIDTEELISRVLSEGTNTLSFAVLIFTILTAEIIL